MSQQSSSVGQNPAPKQKVPNQGELKICILVSFLWSNTSNGPIATRDELLASIREYIGQRQGTLPELESMLKFYTNLPRALGRIHQVQDEDLLGLFISRVTPNIDVFKRVTSITMSDDLAEKLSRKAREHMTKIAENMEKDGRMKNVKAAWNKYVGEVDLAKQPLSLASDNFPKSEIGIVNLGADILLQSKDL